VRNGGFWLSTIGAPEEILSSSGSNSAIDEELRNETAKGRRVIAVAEKQSLLKKRICLFRS